MPVAINGTTGVDLHKDGSVAQTDLAPNVVGTGPCFSAYRNSSQVIAALATIQQDVKQYDTANALASGIFTAPVAGYYQFIGYAANATSACTMNQRFKKNVAEYYPGTYATASVNSVGMSAQIYLAIGDTVEYQVSMGISQSLATGLSGNYFQGFLARSV